MEQKILHNVLFALSLILYFSKTQKLIYKATKYDTLKILDIQNTNIAKTKQNIGT